MILHLAKKELAEHRRALIALVLVQGVTLGLSMIALLGDRVISVLSHLRFTLVLFAPLAAVVLCQAAFAKELRSRTVLFLEALPTSRARVFVAKLLVSLGLFVFLVGLAFFAVVALSWKADAIDGPFLAVLASRSFTWTLAVYGVALLGAVLGRFRIPFFLSLVLAAFFYDYAGGSLRSFGPLALVSMGFESDRTWPPVIAFVSGSGVFLAGLAVAIALVLGRDGSIAVLLGERMSHREKVIVAGVLIAALVVTNIVVERRRKEPFTLTGPRVIARTEGRSSLSVDRGDLEPRAANALATRTHRALVELAAYLEIDHLEPAFLVHRADLDPGRFEVGTLAKREGTLVRANLAEGASDDLLAYLGREVLDVHTDGRTWLEGRLWVRDGIAERWAERVAPRTSGSDEAADDRSAHDRRVLRALYAVEQGYSIDDLGRWLTVRDRLSEPIAGALAWSVLDVLARVRGEDAVQRLAIAVLGQRVSRDVLALRRINAAPATELLPELTGIDAAELARLWREHMAAERVRLAEPLARLPHLGVTFEVTSESALSRAVRYRVTEDARGELERVSILFDELWGLDEVMERQKLDREVLARGAARTGRLPRTFSSGARLYLALAAWVPELGCEVISNAERRTIE